MELMMEQLCTLLHDAGLHVIRGLPADSAPRLDAPACAVTVEQASLSDAGFAQYLGQSEQEGESCELYGMQLEGTASIRFFGPTRDGAQACISAVSTALDALVGARRTLGLRGMEVSSCRYDAKYDHFSATIQVRFRAWAYAATDGETPQFTDFNLRGELQ